MKNFKIREWNKNIEATIFNLGEGFHYKINKKNELEVSEIIIWDVQVIDSLIATNFDKHYKKILEYYFKVLQDNDGDENQEGNLMIALDEVARLRNILFRKYHIFISKKTEDMLLKKLKLLENEIRSKIIDVKLIREQEENLELYEVKSKGR